MLKKILIYLLAFLPLMLQAQAGYYKIENKFNERNWLYERNYYDGNTNNSVVVMTEEWEFDDVGNITHYQRTTTAPDLRINSILPSGAVLAGSSIQVTVNYENMGLIATPTNCQIGLWLSQQNNTYPNAPIQTIPVAAALAAGSTGTGIVTITIPSNISGSWFLLGKIDHNSNVIEKNELNNANYTSLTVNSCTNLAANPTIINDPCGLHTGEVSVNPSGGQGSYTYSWYMSGQTTPSVSNLGVGFYTVKITDGWGCTKIEGLQINGAANPFVVNPASAQPDICGQGTGSATISYSGGTPPYAVTWTGNGYTSNATNINNLSIGTYNVTVTDANGCTDNSSTIVTGANPDFDFQQAGTSCSATISLTGVTGNANFFWSGGLGYGPSQTIVSGASYLITATDQAGCVFTYPTGVVSCQGPPFVSGITNAQEQDLTIFPNPSDGIYLIQSKNVSIKHLKVYDIQGKCVRDQAFELLPSEQKSIDIKDLANGIYLFVFQITGNGFIQTQLIKE